jgi:hypothetical protein
MSLIQVLRGISQSLSIDEVDKSSGYSCLIALSNELFK